MSNILGHALIEFPHLIVAIGISQREHWVAVCHLGKALRTVSPDTLCGGIRSDQIRMLLLQTL